MADNNLGTYSPDDCVAIITYGEIAHAVSGYAEGTFITAERTNPYSTMVSGADQTGYRVFRRNDSGTITFSLHQSSQTNDVFNQLLELDMETRDNSALFTISVVDGTGRTRFFAKDCFIEGKPSAAFSTEGEGRDWVITSNTLDMDIGGNAKIGAEVVAQLEKLGFDVPARWRS